MTYSTAGVGSSQQLSMEFMAQTFDLKLTHVPYRNSPQAIADIATAAIPAIPTRSTACLRCDTVGRIARPRQPQAALFTAS